MFFCILSWVFFFNFYFDKWFKCQDEGWINTDHIYVIKISCIWFYLFYFTFFIIKNPSIYNIMKLVNKGTSTHNILSMSDRFIKPICIMNRRRRGKKKNYLPPYIIEFHRLWEYKHSKHLHALEISLYYPPRIASSTARDPTYHKYHVWWMHRVQSAIRIGTSWI